MTTVNEDESNDSIGSIDDSESIGSDGSDAMVNLADIPGTGESREEEAADYEMLSPDQLTQHMADITNEVSQIIQVRPTYLRLLLAHFKWDKHALIEYYFEHERSRTFTVAGLMDPATLSARFPAPPILTPEVAGATGCVCDICCLSYPRDQMSSLACHHPFCKECWQRYLKWKVVEESQIDRIYCPSFGCTVLIEDEMVFEMLTDPGVRRRFQKLISNSFVMNNRSLTWCPGADCGFAARCFGPREARLITCTNCSESFCFACGQPWHDPVRCEQLKIWLKRIIDDAGTSNWILANTKECPKCHVTIEKNGGCNHMTCRNADCKFEFCWLCLDRWEPHGTRWYNCNRYDEEAAKQARDAQANSRISLERYLFYFNRYVNHFQSLRFENKLYESVQNKMEAMQAHGTSWIDVKFFRKVVDVLCRCRRTLMYTYAFAFFLKKNNHSLIFESNQSDLEHATEQLSGLLDRDSSSLELSEFKQKVQDKARYCESRRQVLLDHVHEGYEKDFWELGDY
ncbi:unnamed protein product [Calicophoron daubneyi]|uniref:RBR-type E3 ubiquitin transferase n=1 Tax=Calicophoron daubneyi TaxID=300641 RepID=A0AAV2TVI9_CALDB